MSSQSNIAPALQGGARAGAVAAAAVTGSMLGFGLRGGMAARPFNAAAVLLLGSRARDVWGYVTTVSVVGELVVVAGCVIAGALCGLLLQLVPGAVRLRHPRLFAFSLALAAAAVALSLLIVRAPEFIGVSPSGALTISEGALLSIVAAVAYASGMGLAR